MASQKITPYVQGRCHGKASMRPDYKEIFSLGILESDVIRLESVMSISTRSHISRTKTDRHHYDWEFNAGPITGLFDLSSLGEFERYTFRLPSNTRKNGLLVFVGDEIEQNRKLLDSLGYREANDLLRFEQEKFPQFMD